MTIGVAMARPNIAMCRLPNRSESSAADVEPASSASPITAMLNPRLANDMCSDSTNQSPTTANTIIWANGWSDA